MPTRTLILTPNRKEVLRGVITILLRRRVFLEIQAIPLVMSELEDALACPYNRAILQAAYLVAPDMVRGTSVATYKIVGPHPVFFCVRFAASRFAVKPTISLAQDYNTYATASKHDGALLLESATLQEWAGRFHARVRVMLKVKQFLFNLINGCRTTTALYAGWPNVLAVLGAVRRTNGNAATLYKEIDDVPRKGLSSHRPWTALQAGFREKIAAIDPMFAEATILPEATQNIIPLQDGLDLLAIVRGPEEAVSED